MFCNVVKLVIVFIFICLDFFSQTEKDFYKIGYFVDINNEAINGYLDSDYSPRPVISVTTDYEKEFVPGVFYDLNNNMFSGYLQFKKFDNSLYFKKSPEGNEIKVSPDKSNGFVAAGDSFIVIKNFYTGRDISVRKFVKVIRHSEDWSILVYNWKAREARHETFIAKKESDGSLTTFLINTPGYVYIVEQVFGNVLKDLTLEDSLTRQDIPVLSLIKMYSYRKKTKEGKNLYFNSSWYEVKDTSSASYFATIFAEKEMLFRLKFFTIYGAPVSERMFDFYNRSELTGDVKWYYSGGELRKKKSYTNYILKQGEGYHKNGALHYSYTLDDSTIIYNKVNNPGGMSILDKSGNGKETLYDSVLKREITRYYKDHKMVTSFYKDTLGQIVCQLTKNNGDFKNENLLMRDAAKELKYPINSIIQNVQGVVLIRCLISETGTLLETDLVKGISPECDELVLNFFNKRKGEKLYKPAHIDGQAVKRELILPVKFAINPKKERDIKDALNWSDNSYFQIIMQPTSMPYRYPIYGR